MTTIEELEHWQSSGGKARDCSIWHDNGYGAVDGWNIELRAGAKSIHVCGWSVAKESNPDSPFVDSFAGLEIVIKEALRRWDDKYGKLEESQCLK